MTEESGTQPSDPAGNSGIDTSVPHSARIWNYWLGGKDHYTIDRTIGDQFRQVFPGIVDMARADREFLSRAVRYLAGPAGIRQFLDIGTGLPTADNTHQLAQRAHPDCRIVYVDNDPLVLAHARALLTDTDDDTVTYLNADLHEPDTIMARARHTLDFHQPIAVMLMGILGHISNDTQVHAILQRLHTALPPGSYVTVSDGSNTDTGAEAAQRYYNTTSGGIPYHFRNPDTLRAFLQPLELIEPGFLPCLQWRPELATPTSPNTPIGQYGGIGHKPPTNEPPAPPAAAH